MSESKLTRDQVATTTIANILNENNNKKGSKPIFKKALAQVLSTKGQLSMIILSCLVMSGISLYIGFSPYTVPILRSTANICLTITLGLLAIFFTGYTLFQALASRGTLVSLLTSTTNIRTSLFSKKEIQVSVYEAYNLYFLGISYYTSILILLNFCLKIILLGLPDNFYMAAFDHILNCTFATMLIFVYLVVNAKLIVEVKSFLFNIYQSVLVSDVNKILYDK